MNIKITRYLLIVIAILSTNNILAQCFAYKIGGKGDDAPRKIAKDNQSNIYVAGQFIDTVDFDPGPDSVKFNSKSFDIFVAKFDNNGKLIWARQMGGPNADRGESVFLDANLNVYIVGYFRDSCDFDPGSGKFLLKSAGDVDVFVTKLDRNGNFIWAKSLGGTGSDLANEGFVNSKGEVCIAGGFTGTVDFDPGIGVNKITSSGLADCFILKLDSLGNYKWVYNYGGTGNDLLWSLKSDSKGNILATGGFLSTVDFDSDKTKTFNLTAAGGVDVYVIKISDGGIFNWVKRLGGTLSEAATDIEIDSKDNIITIGWFQGTADFDPGSGTYNLIATNGSAFTLKLDSAGLFKWAIQLNANLSAINSDKSNNLLIFGHFSGYVDCNPGSGTYQLTASGTKDGLALKLTENGVFVWAKQFGRTNSVYAIDIKVDDKGAIFLTGFFDGHSDFDPEYGGTVLTSTAASHDIFLVKIPANVFDSLIISAAGPTTICDGDSIVLKSSIPYGNVWVSTRAWPTGDTTRSIILKTLQQATYYSLVTNGTCTRRSNGISIKINPLPSKPVIGGPNSVNICSGDSILLGTSSYSSGLLWSTGETTKSIYVKTAGNYTVAYTNPSTGCKSDVSAPITVNVLPQPTTPTISANGPTTFCATIKRKLTSSAPWGNLWSTGDTSRFIEIGYSGSFSVTVSFGKCKSTSSAIKLITIDPPIYYTTLKGGNPFCEGDSLVCISSAKWGNRWSTGDTTKTIVIKKAGKFWLDVTNNICTNNNGDTIDALVEPLPKFITQPTDQIVNVNSSAVFEVKVVANFPLYGWQKFDGINYVNLTEGGQFSGVSTNKLTVKNVTLANSNEKYRCYVLSSFCGSLSNTATLKVSNSTNSVNLSGQVQFSLYPNPSQSEIFLTSNNSLHDKIYNIFDLTGRVVSTGKIKHLNGSARIFINTLETGIYTLQVDNLGIVKFVKE
jgi:hypothetical protein